MAFWMLAASTAMSVWQGSQAADAQNDLYSQNADNAIIAQTYENQGINEELREDQEIASIQKRELQRAALEAQSSADAAGRELQGNSVARDRQNIVNRAGEKLSNINANLAGAARQTEARKRGTGAKATSRINSVSRAKYNPIADVAKGGLAIAGDFGAEKALAKKGGPGDYGFKDYATSWLS